MLKHCDQLCRRVGSKFYYRLCPPRFRCIRVALPFCHLTFKAEKPVHREKYPDICRTWGDWIKARRLDLKLTKAQLSLNLNVSDITIYLWEKNKVQPSLAQIPKVIEFLGRDPFETSAGNLADKIKNYRRLHGLSQKISLNIWGSIKQLWQVGKGANTSQQRSYSANWP
jgi:DNA-binding XRE family transcriptional regulator